MIAIPLLCYRRRSYERIYLDHPASHETQLHNLEQIADETGLLAWEVEDRLRGFLYADASEGDSARNPDSIP